MSTTSIMETFSTLDGWVLDPTARGVHEVIVDPATAAEWLLLHSPEMGGNDLPVNRSVRTLKVNMYHRDMLAGAWDSENGETIKFATDGTLRDGQHRLLAQVKANVTIKYLIVTGVAPKAQLTIDIGGARTAGDQLRLDGVPNPDLVAAIACRVILFKRGAITVGGNSRPTVREQMAYQNDRDLVHRAAEVAVRAKSRRLAGSHATVGACYFLAAEKRSIANGYEIDETDEEATRRTEAAELFFVDQLIDMVNVDFGDPARTLRLRLDEDKARFGRVMQRDMVLRYTLLAWNQFREGRKITKLQRPRGGWTTENTPIPK